MSSFLKRVRKKEFLLRTRKEAVFFLVSFKFDFEVKPNTVRPGVNFTNVLRPAFTHTDPKSAIKLLNLTVFFALLGSARVKAACRTLVKLTPVLLKFKQQQVAKNDRH